MSQQLQSVVFTAAGLLALATAGAAVADHVVQVGQTLTLTEDLVLSGNESLEIKGTPDRRCTLAGNGHGIRSKGEWTGSIRIRYCELHQLGAPAKLTADGRRIAAEFSALDLTISGRGGLVVEHCVFDACAAVHLQTDGESSATI